MMEKKCWFGLLPNLYRIHTVDKGNSRDIFERAHHSKTLKCKTTSEKTSGGACRNVYGVCACVSRKIQKLMHAQAGCRQDVAEISEKNGVWSTFSVFFRTRVRKPLRKLIAISYTLRVYDDTGDRKTFRLCWRT